MTVPILTLRSVKGSALTHAEMDQNLTNLQAPNVTVRAGSTQGYISTAYDFVISNTATVGASISGNTVSLTSLVVNPTYTFSNTATLTLSNVSGNISGTVASTTFSAGSGSATIAPGGTLSIANSATVQGSIAGTTLTLQSNISATSLGAITGISMIAGGTTTTGATGFTISNTATIGASLSTNTLSVSLGTVGTAGTYQGAITTDVYGRITAGQNGFTANIAGNGQYLQNIILDRYQEKVANITGGGLTGTVTLDANTAPIQTAGTTGNITINTNNLTNFQPGESVTLILRHNANARTFTSNLKFVNSNKTIAGNTISTDVVTIFYDGVEYLGTVAQFRT